MDISLDQVKALIAVADTGSIVAASKKLNKTHTAVLYQLKQLETQIGFSLINRENYKASLTPQGQEFLLEARRFISAEERLLSKASQIEKGGLGRWHLVYDTIFPVQQLFSIVAQLQAKTEVSVKLIGDSLRSVEKTFWREDADFMLGLFPSENPELVNFEIGQLRSIFVAHKSFTSGSFTKRRTAKDKEPARTNTKNFSNLDTSKLNLIIVRGVDPQVSMSTDNLIWANKIVVNDFYSKKDAVVQGLGVGWLPEHLVTNEIKKGTLVKINAFGGGEHFFRVYYSTRKILARDPFLARTLMLIKKTQWLKT